METIMNRNAFRLFNKNIKLIQGGSRDKVGHVPADVLLSFWTLFSFVIQKKNYRYNGVILQAL